MNSKRPVLRGLVLMSGAQGVVLAVAFVRNLILARLLGPADFGVVAVVAAALSFLEMASDLSLGKALVQAPSGNRTAFQDAIQFLSAMRGILLGLFLFGMAGPIASVMRCPDYTWALQLASLAPVIKGWEHCDYHRWQRRLRFGAAVWVQVTPVLLSTLLVLPHAVWWPNPGLMAWVAVCQSLIGVGVSHAISRRD
ncbi:MAG: oligosaccharide flippase family protein, partial [Planctomycetota bacterium]